MSDHKENNIRLNIAGRSAAYFVESKLTALIILFSLAIGIISFLVTPKEENPQIVVPAANVIITKPGASPKEIEQLVVKPLESILQGLSGVKHLYGTAMDSMGVVTVEFAVGDDKEDSLVKLYDHIMGNLDRKPPGTNDPIVKSVDVDNVPVLTLSFSSETRTDSELRQIANRVKEELRYVSGVSLSDIHGGRKRQINVMLNLDQMKHYKITLPDIQKILEATNVDIPSGTFTNNNQIATVHSGAMLQDAEDVKSLVVGTYDHKPVLLKDIAEVNDGPGEVEHVTKIGFGPAYRGDYPSDAEIPAVTIAIAKRTGTNAVTVTSDVLETLDEIKPRLVPEDVKVLVTRNDGLKAQDAVNTLAEHMLIAIVTIIILLFVSLGWRAASVVTLTIPLILLITLAVGMVAGQSINRITLFALILSLGLLVDDSIVVIENISRHLVGKSVDKVKTIVLAVNEIGKPTNLATFAVMLAFIPMFFVTGMMGPYMAPIPFNVPVAMIVSLLFAYTVAPWAANRWLPTTGVAHQEHHTGVLENGYSRFMTLLLSSKIARWLFFMALSLVMVAVLAMPAFDMVLFKMLPKNNTNTFVIQVEMSEGTSLEEADRVTRLIGDVLRENPDVETYETSVGKAGVTDFNGLLRGSGFLKGPHIAELRVNLSNKHQRKKSSIDIALDLRPILKSIQDEVGGVIKLVEDPPGPPVRATILAEIYGPDYEQLRQIATALRENVFMTTEDMVDVDDSVTEDYAEYKIKVDQEKASLAGISSLEVSRSIHTFLAGNDIGTVHIEDELEPVVIQFRIPTADRTGPDDLKKIRFTARNGNQVSLEQIASITKQTADKPIHHKDRRPVVYVTGDLASTSQVYAVLKMYSYLKENPLPGGIKLNQYFMASPDNNGYSLRWDGEMRLTLDVFRDLGLAFGVAILLIFLLLVGYYKSFMIPVIVMGAIPLTIIGVFPGHAIMGQYFTATSMIGMIALAGIVVRNSLLLIDFILDYRKGGHSVHDAVLQAGVTRLRPIMLTALAIILGTLIMIVDPVFGGLAISLIFGALVSTVLTLFVIPLLYAMRYGQRRQTI